MSVDIRSGDRRKYMNEIQAREKEIAAGLLKVSQPESPKLQETDKRHRREIANSNERRRMQYINAGFSSLRALIPHLEGEKLSKATILQHTTEYITSLEKEKRQLQLQVEHSMRLLSDRGASTQQQPQQSQLTQGQQEAQTSAADAGADSFSNCAPPPSKRKKRITESSDEGVGALSDESDEGGQACELLRQEIAGLRHELEGERQRCQALESRNRLLEGQLISLLQQAQQAVGHGIEHVVPVKTETMQSAVTQESLYNREVVEVIGSLQGMPTPPREDSAGQHYHQMQPPRPLSPTPECGMMLESGHHHHHPQLVESVHVYKRPTSPVMRASHSPPIASNAEVVATYQELSAPGVTFQRVGVLPEHANVVESTAVATPVAPTVPTVDQPVRGYRDHPRRRHRQQAALERQRAQQEEEERRRKEQEEQEKLLCVSHPQAYRPYQNLENLVEAIKHIEGEDALGEPGRRYEGGQRQVMHNSSEETSSMSDPDELKSESSGRDSPLQHHRLHRGYQQHQHHLIHQQHQHSILGEQHHLQLSSSPLRSSSPPSSSSRTLSSVPVEGEVMATSVTPVGSSSLTDYHPTTASLLHHPSPFYRPGVIVHKQ